MIFSRFSDVQKNKMLIPVLILSLVLCWFLAFSKTVDAIRLNYKLKKQSDTDQNISFNPGFMKQKLMALDEILKGYQVGEQWNNKLWLQASVLSAKQGVAIDFVLDKPGIASDSTMLGQSQSLYFYGKFVQLVKLIDTLETVKHIGKISAVQIKAPKQDGVGNRANNCMLRLDFRGNKSH